MSFDKQSAKDPKAGNFNYNGFSNFSLDIIYDFVVFILHTLDFYSSNSHIDTYRKEKKSK